MKYILAFIILLSFLIGIYFYPQLPDPIISHWSANGQANGSLPKFWGAFILPMITLVLVLILYNLPRLDPLKRNVNKFRSYYDSFIVTFALFMSILQIMILLINKGVPLNINIVLSVLLSALFFHIGILLKHTERNWFIGIRTPWTLADDKTWKKTHGLASILFYISAMFSLIGAFLPSYAIWFILIPILLSTIITVIYSYLVFKRR